MHGVHKVVYYSHLLLVDIDKIFSMHCYTIFGFTATVFTQLIRTSDSVQNLAVRLVFGLIL